MSGSPEHHLAYLAHLLATLAGVLAVVRLTRGRPSWRSHALLALGCVAMGLAAFRASDPPDLFHDFWIAYYPAGRAVLEDPAALRALTERGVSGFVNLPVVAYLFAPFGALPKAWAIGSFSLLGLAALALAWGLLVRLGSLDVRGAWLLALLFAANGPLHYSLREGNTSHILLLPLAGALVLMHGGRPGLAGVLLGAATLIKPPLALFGLLFLLRRDVRGLLGFAAAGASAVALSLLLFGWAQNLAWFEACVLTFSRERLGAFNVQSIAAFLFRLEDGGQRLMDWTPVSPSAANRLLAQSATAVLCLLTAAAWIAGRRGSTAEAPDRAALRLNLEFCLVLCLAVILSPLSWSHYYVWLLLPAALLLTPRGGAARWPAVLAIALLTPLVWPLSPPPDLASDLYARLYVSHLLFGGVLMWGITAWRLASLGPARSAARLAMQGAAAAK